MLACLDWSAQGRLAWLAGEPPTLWMADAPGGEAQAVDRSRTAKDCRWSPNGSRLAVSGDGVRLYSAEGTTLHTIPLGTDVYEIAGLSWSRDGSILAGIESIKRVEAPGFPHRLWVKPVDGEARSWPTPTGGEIYRIDWDPDSGGLYAHLGGSIHDWNAGNGIWRFDVDTGESVLVAKGCCVHVFHALPGGGFAGITVTRHFAEDSIAIFNADGSMRTVVVRGHPLLPEDTSGTGICDGTRFWSLELAPTGDRLLLGATGRYATWRCDYSPPL